MNWRKTQTLRVRLAPSNRFKPPPTQLFFTDRSKAVVLFQMLSKLSIVYYHHVGENHCSLLHFGLTYLFHLHMMRNGKYIT